MSEQKNQNPSTDKEVKPSSSTIEQESPEKEIDDMKKWADQEKKKEEETLANKTKNAGNKKNSAKEQPEKKPAQKVEKKSAAKEMPKMGTVVKNSGSKDKATAKTPSKPVQKPSVASKTTPTKAGKKKHNYLLWATGVVILIPCLVLLYIIVGSMGSSDEPIEGNRFKGSLDPKISEEEVSGLQSSLSLENVESINVTLKSATLRITINTNDDVSQEAMSDMMAQAYDQVIEKFPVETYFQNRMSDDKVIKMYDLDIDIYNFIPSGDEDGSGQIHMSRTKNSAAENYVDDVLSSPKDDATSEELLNPDTSTPPSEEGPQEGE